MAALRTKTRWSAINLVVSILGLMLGNSWFAYGQDRSTKATDGSFVLKPDWMDQACKPPEAPCSFDVGLMKDVLQATSGNRVITLDDWMVHRESIRHKWLAFLGPMPQTRPQVQLQVLQSDTIQVAPDSASLAIGNTTNKSLRMPVAVRRELVQYEGEPGWKVQGYLLRPESLTETNRLPAVVVLHPTTKENIDEVAGLMDQSSRATGLRLAQLGYVVFCPRCFLWQDAVDYNAAVDQHAKRHPGVKGMAKMLYDAQRAVDVIASLTYVDSTRIGAMGHSLGAKETLYLAAFDPRIQVGVFSEGGLGLPSTNWDAPWYLGPECRDAPFPLNHHELLALIAPRPFLLLAGESGPGAADGERSWPIIQAARPAWLLYSEKPRIGMVNHRRGHIYDEEQFTATRHWLDSVLFD